MKMKAVYKDHVLKPLNDISHMHLDNGAEVEIDIKQSPTDRITGLLKHVDLTSLELQHKAKDMWVKGLVSDRH
ncbi:MAG: DUF104 domain-containing protein [Methanosarcinaceae archaeon]|nr:DUF104 domain-containing protein [Methanosarcinaceae archaeon]